MMLGGQGLLPATLPPESRIVLIVLLAGWSSWPAWTVQPAASPYTDYAILFHDKDLQ